MAMVKCIECGSKVSTAAAACPKCGAPPPPAPAPKKVSRATWWVIGGFGIAMLAAIGMPGPGAGDGTSTPRPAAAAKPPVLDAETQLAKDRFDAQRVMSVAGARQLKASAKDPQSFELKEATVSPDGSSCYTFRARNSFNAMLQGHAVLIAGKTTRLLVDGHDDGFASAWNKHCQRVGEDMMPVIDRLGLDG